MMQRIGFVLLDGFALMSTAAAMEPLRAANLFSPAPLYALTLLSEAGGTVRASLGAGFDTRAVGRAGTRFDLVFVVAGGDGPDPLRLRSPGLFAWLRQLDRAGVALGGISGGGAVLAQAGLMGARRFTVHWHHLEALRAAHPDLAVERRLYVIDRDRHTCAGGTAPLDMMHALIAAQHGAPFARRISDWFIQTAIRAPDAPQQTRAPDAPGPVRAALDLMESHVADPLDLGQLAALAGLSPRQLQRQFHAALGQTVMAAYRDLRLDIARRLVRDTRASLAEVAEMTGFATQSAFAVLYRRRFGTPPGADRRGHAQF